MSQKELSHLEVLTKVHKKRLKTLQAAEILDFSTRQVKCLPKALNTQRPKNSRPKRPCF